MFTVKATYLSGHIVKSCAAYEFLNGRSIAGNQSLTLFNQNGEVQESFDIVGTVYIMNANGKTVDTFHASPRGETVTGPPPA